MTQTKHAWNHNYTDPMMPPSAMLAAAEPMLAPPAPQLKVSKPQRTSQPRRTTEPYALATFCLFGLLLVGVGLVEYSVARMKYEARAAVERAQDDMREALNGLP